MLSTVLAVHEGLGTSRRLPSVVPVGQKVSAVEIGMLVLLGVAAAAVSAFVRLNLGIPGHNIIRAIFPMALGLALVPRRGTASIVGVSGLAGGLLFSLGGARGIGAGAMTGLVLIGLLLDVALSGARNGRSVYLRLALAGLAANMVAFIVRGGTKLLVSEPLAFWLPKALITYPISGVLAGLISAAVWFRFADDRLNSSREGLA